MTDLDTLFEEYEDVRHSDVVRDVFYLKQRVGELKQQVGEVTLDKVRAENYLADLRRESTEVLRLVRDTTLSPDDRLAAIEELLTNEPEVVDDAC